jgi:hypothetical protein
MSRKTAVMVTRASLLLLLLLLLLLFFNVVPLVVVFVRASAVANGVGDFGSSGTVCVSRYVL